jgi:hypothetical protein
MWQETTYLVLATTFCYVSQEIFILLCVLRHILHSSSLFFDETHTNIHSVNQIWKTHSFTTL